MHKVLVNRLVRLAQEKVWYHGMTLAVDWDVKHQTKQKNKKPKGMWGPIVFVQI